MSKCSIVDHGNPYFIQVFAMPLQNKQKESTREQKNKCIGKK